MIISCKEQTATSLFLIFTFLFFIFLATKSLRHKVSRIGFTQCSQGGDYLTTNSRILNFCRKIFLLPSHSGEGLGVRLLFHERLKIFFSISYLYIYHFTFNILHSLTTYNCNTIFKSPHCSFNIKYFSIYNVLTCIDTLIFIVQTIPIINSLTAAKGVCFQVFHLIT